MIAELPTELIVMILELLPPQDQLQLRASSARLNSIVRGLGIVKVANETVRTTVIAQALRAMLVQMQTYYKRYNWFPPCLIRDEILLDMPFRTSLCEPFIEYLVETALCHHSDRVFNLALDIAINLSSEPRTTLGCRILKSSKVLNRLLGEIEKATYHDRDAALLIGNCHDHRTHFGRCPFKECVIRGDTRLQSVLPRCKTAVNLCHKRHPHCPDSQFAADMWNSSTTKKMTARHV